MARYVVVGAGAIGGVIGASLFEHEQDVTFVARGAQYEAIAEQGLRVDSPKGTDTWRIPVVDDVAKAKIQSDDVIAIAVKSQDTAGVVSAMVQSVRPSTPIVCFQNGVENERVVARYFSDVYGAMVLTHSSFIDPGVIQVDHAPTIGACDIGRYPQGTSDVVTGLVADLSAADWSVLGSTDVMTIKYAKLLDNLGMATQIIFDRDGPRGEVAKRAQAEGIACLAAAGIRHSSPEEMRERREIAALTAPPEWKARGGTSTWQSVARGAGSVETDFLNGEIVLLGRLHGVPTPVNASIQQMAREIVTGQRTAEVITEEAFLAAVDS